MKTKYLAIAASALLAIGLSPLASAERELGAAQAGIEVITVVGKRPAARVVEFAARPVPEGIEVITVVGKRDAVHQGLERAARTSATPRVNSAS